MFTYTYIYNVIAAAVTECCRFLTAAAVIVVVIITFNTVHVHVLPDMCLYNIIFFFT